MKAAEGRVAQAKNLGDQRALPGEPGKRWCVVRVPTKSQFETTKSDQNWCKKRKMDERPLKSFFTLFYWETYLKIPLVSRCCVRLTPCSGFGLQAWVIHWRSTLILQLKMTSGRENKGGFYMCHGYIDWNTLLGTERFHWLPTVVCKIRFFFHIG